MKCILWSCIWNLGNINSNHYYHYHYYYYYHPVSAGHTTTCNILCTDVFPWLWKGKQNGVPSARVALPVCKQSFIISFIYWVTHVAWQTNLVYHDVLNYYNFHHKHREQNISMAWQPWQRWVAFKISYKVLVINMWDQEITTQEMDIITSK